MWRDRSWMPFLPYCARLGGPAQDGKEIRFRGPKVRKMTLTNDKMILESCQALSRASIFVCGDDLRDSAVATMMFKVAVVSYEPVARL